MASQGKFGGNRVGYALQISCTTNGTTKVYAGAAPADGRIVAVSHVVTTDTDAEQTITVENETTGVSYGSITVANAPGAGTGGNTTLGTSEIAVSAGDIISIVSDGAGTAGVAFFTVYIEPGVQ